MLKVLITALVFVTLGANARADDLIAVKSTRPVKETLDRLQKLVTDDGFFIVGRVPHSEAAKDAGLTLRPTELMIFGKPQSGTPIMVCNQRAGIDLPLHALAWQDEVGQVWLGMVDPKALKERYALGPNCDGAIATMKAAVRKLLDGATTP
ncbi:DUF302 domain-containing protein [Methylobacterium sp. V23]|jgi:uncharacterized protein (DUF302 family)|uniref:DUF302 domain-containing protein n=1 Tax=Methylobacterium sp. V23 TaxID=2044878 RepID=UPI000CDA094C|nr:DUF302 domain-containing protein [Methylobacterium sp. V23]POR40442.1 hypothetical protein CRT23_23765 [Methylobacterium sp. V23]